MWMYTYPHVTCVPLLHAMRTYYECNPSHMQYCICGLCHPRDQAHPCVQITHMHTCTYHSPHTPRLAVAKTCKQFLTISIGMCCLSTPTCQACPSTSGRAWICSWVVWLLYYIIRLPICWVKGIVDWIAVVCAVCVSVCTIHHSYNTVYTYVYAIGFPLKMEVYLQ